MSRMAVDPRQNSFASGSWSSLLSGQPSSDFRPSSSDTNPLGSTDWSESLPISQQTDWDEISAWPCQSRPLTTRKPLPVSDTSILSQLPHLDLFGKIVVKEDEAKGFGAYSEVFKGRCRYGLRGEIDVAIKRLRFHVNSTDCSRVS
jgi:hypothetical protein